MCGGGHRSSLGVTDWCFESGRELSPSVPGISQQRQPKNILSASSNDSRCSQVNRLCVPVYRGCIKSPWHCTWQLCTRRCPMECVGQHNPFVEDTQSYGHRHLQGICQDWYAVKTRLYAAYNLNHAGSSSAALLPSESVLTDRPLDMSWHACSSFMENINSEHHVVLCLLPYP